MVRRSFSTAPDAAHPGHRCHLRRPRSGPRLSRNCRLHRYRAPPDPRCHGGVPRVAGLNLIPRACVIIHAAVRHVTAEARPCFVASATRSPPSSPLQLSSLTCRPQRLACAGYQSRVRLLCIIVPARLPGEGGAGILWVVPPRERGVKVGVAGEVPAIGPRQLPHQIIQRPAALPAYRQRDVLPQLLPQSRRFSPSPPMRDIAAASVCAPSCISDQSWRATCSTCAGPSPATVPVPMTTRHFVTSLRPIAAISGSSGCAAARCPPAARGVSGFPGGGVSFASP